MKRNIAFLLVGVQDSGKTNTLKQWCSLRKYTLSLGPNIFTTEINGNKELVFVISSSKEEQEGHNPNRVRTSLLKSLNYCHRVTKNNEFSRFILVMASNVGYPDSKNKPVRLYREAPKELLKTLKEEKFDVHPIYLRRKVNDKHEQNKLDNFCEEFCEPPHITSEKKYKKQAEDLDKKIIRIVSAKK